MSVRSPYVFVLSGPNGNFDNTNITVTTLNKRTGKTVRSFVGNYTQFASPGELAVIPP